MNNYTLNESYTSQAVIKEGMVRVFGWMGIALAITAAAAFGVAQSPTLISYLVQNPFALFGLLIAQLGLVIALSGFVHKLSYGAAVALFVLYALLTGITLSSIFIIYTTASIVSTFIVASGMFGAMAIYGAFTESDLTSVGSIGRMVLVGLILALLVNLFLKSPLLDLITAIIGVVLFAGLTAFDVQRIAAIMATLLAEREMMAKATIVGALTLYLDFINLFLSLLRIMGSGRGRD